MSNVTVCVCVVLQDKLSEQCDCLCVLCSRTSLVSNVTVCVCVVLQDKILDVDTSNLTVKVEAGMIGQDMEQQVHMYLCGVRV